MNRVEVWRVCGGGVEGVWWRCRGCVVEVGRVYSGGGEGVVKEEVCVWWSWGGYVFAAVSPGYKVE